MTDRNTSLGDGEAPDAGASRASLLSRGTRYQFGVAVALISVIPCLACVYLWSQGSFGGEEHPVIPWIVWTTIIVMLLLGYLILARHMATISHLRRYLGRIADGSLPADIALAPHEHDIAAIQKYMNLILFDTKWKITMIENQRRTLIDAERQRVMIESLGTACHHLGQPITAITVYLELMKRGEASSERAKMIDECLAAVDSFKTVIDKLRTVSEYRTRPYMGHESDEVARPDARILDVSDSK